jgi:hypothetical protein
MAGAYLRDLLENRICGFDKAKCPDKSPGLKILPLVDPPAHASATASASASPPTPKKGR